jgi:hypothetical protein
MTVLPFPSRPPAGPIQFTPAERQAIAAIGYVPGLEVSIHCCDDGDQWAAVGCANGLNGIDPLPVSKVVNGFEVSDGGRVICTVGTLQEALDFAKITMLDRIESADEFEAAWEAKTWALARMAFGEAIADAALGKLMMR